MKKGPVRTALNRLVAEIDSYADPFPAHMTDAVMIIAVQSILREAIGKRSNGYPKGQPAKKGSKSYDNNAAALEVLCILDIMFDLKPGKNIDSEDRDEAVDIAMEQKSKYWPNATREAVRRRSIEITRGFLKMKAYVPSIAYHAVFYPRESEDLEC